MENYQIFFDYEVELLCVLLNDHRPAVLSLLWVFPVIVYLYDDEEEAGSERRKRRRSMV